MSKAHPIKLDPQTRVASLLLAVPSARIIFDRLGIAVRGNDNQTLQQVCMDSNISLEDFLSTMDEIDWNEESS
jgi:hypothetical protein